ncbi:MAG: HAMP domain-containing histidine kinase, partial [Armatimonadetes bacterium]|nr:HAMP domain-containing histidine kinase [Armatimonadota bacterium]
ALVGLMVAANTTSHRELSPQELRLLRALGGLASMALDRARVNQMRDMMARSVSHELRAPLASIRAYVEVVLDEGVGPINQEQRVFLQRAAKACDYLQRLVEDLLDLSRLRSGEITLRPSLTDLEELLEQILDSLRVRIEDNEVKVETHIAPEVAEVMVDRTRLAQILTNLIDNAVKFNYRGGRVTIEASREGSEVVIAVADTGPGIAPTEQEAIFQEFYRGKNQHTQSRVGAGLGLAIARRVAGFLGGTLTVESKEGQGSTFVLHFPYKPPESDNSTQQSGEVTDVGIGERLEDTHSGR